MHNDLSSAGRDSRNANDGEFKAAQTEDEIKICIVGVGNLGTSITGGVWEKKVSGTEVIAICDDPKHLLDVKADKKYYLDNGIPRGVGVCTNPIIGEEAARRDSEQIEGLIKGKDLIFLITGLGGRIGTGAVPVIADIARKQGSFVITIDTLPFETEGKIRNDNAREGLEKLKKFSNENILISLDSLRETFPELYLDNFWGVSDKVLAEIVKMIIEPLTKLWNVESERNELRSAFADGGVGTIGIGESESPGIKGLKEAVEEAVSSPLIVLDESRADVRYVPVRNKLVKIHVPPQVLKAKTALVSLSFGDEVHESELTEAVKIIKKHTGENTNMVLTSSPGSTLEGGKMCLVILTGQHFSFQSEENPTGSKGLERSDGTV